MAPARMAAASRNLLAPIVARLGGGGKKVSGHAKLLAHPAYQRLLAAEPFLRRLIPVLILVFLAIVGAARYVQLTQMYDEREHTARAEIDMIASLVASAIDTPDQELPPGDFSTTAQNALADALPTSALGDGKRIYLTDPTGTIVAAAPESGLIGTDLALLLTQAQPLLVFGDRAGILSVTIRNEPAFATARSLADPYGSVVVVQPTAAIEGDWRAQVTLNVSIFVGTSAILLVILYGYFAQSTRANEADRMYAETHKRFDTALMRGRCGLWDWDLASGRMFWSPSMFSILGMTPRDELLGFGEVNRLVHPDDGDLMAIAEHLYETGETSVDRLFRMRHADGSWVWLRARAELVGENGDPHLIGIAVDTTEQIGQAEKSRTADIRLGDAIETISEAFVLWDADNRLVMCNSKYQELYDLSEASVRSGTPYNLVMSAARQPLVRAQIPVEQSEEGARSFEALLEDGRWLQINERQTKDGGFVSVGTDITQIKRHEERLIDGERRLMATIADLRQSRQKLESQAQQLVELADKYAEEKDRAEAGNRIKSEFLANISHELRTPLNAIIGFSEIMQTGMFGDLGSPKYAEYCRDIHGSGKYLLGVINDILDMSRLEAGRLALSMEPLELGPVVEESVRVFAAESETQSIAITASVEPGLVIDADSRSVKQMFLNLISNAVKFTPAGGSITVRARRRGDAALLTIQDTGIGIPKDALPKLGRPFEQVQNQDTKSHKGSGLGLAITRSLAELHGGSLRIRSREGRGTIVAIRLPLHHVASQAAAE